MRSCRTCLSAHPSSSVCRRRGSRHTPRSRSSQKNPHPALSRHIGRGNDHASISDVRRREQETHMALSVQKVLTKIFGSRNDRLLKRYRTIVEQINALEPQVSVKTDDELRARTKELFEGLASKKLRTADVMPEAFALIRESMDRHIGIRNIFNPEENFDPEQFNDEELELYDSVQRHMIQTGESWQRVAIPPKLYAAVRRIYPESRPPFRARCFDVHIIGGPVLYEGKIADMATR